MKLTNRVALGYVILILLVAALLAVQTFAFRRFQLINRRNSGESLTFALIAVELVRDADAVEEHTRRYFDRGDQGSRDELKEFQQRFADALEGIREFRGTDRERSEMERLDRFWRECVEASGKLQPAPSGKNGTQELPVDLTEALSRLRTQSVTVYQALVEDLKVQAAESRRFSERTEFIALWLGCSALALGILIAFLVVRSIAGPLRSLTEGTRAFAEGKAFYRLDTSRRDELSQIAKDFNVIAEKLKGQAGPVAEPDSKKYEL